MWSHKYQIYFLLSGLLFLHFTNAALMSSQASENADEPASQDNAEPNATHPEAVVSTGPLTAAQWKQYLGEQVVAEREKLRSTIIEGYYNVSIAIKKASREIYQLLMDDEKMWSEMEDVKRRDALRNIHIELSNLLKQSEHISMECFAGNNLTMSPVDLDIQERYATMLSDGSAESTQVLAKMIALGFNHVMNNAHIYIMHFWMRTYPLCTSYEEALKAYHGNLWSKDEFKIWSDKYQMTRVDKIVEMMTTMPARRLTP